jgi:hypothetical protein
LTQQRQSRANLSKLSSAGKTPARVGANVGNHRIAADRTSKGILLEEQVKDQKREKNEDKGDLE